MRRGFSIGALLVVTVAACAANVAAQDAGVSQIAPLPTPSPVGTLPTAEVQSLLRDIPHTPNPTTTSQPDRAVTRDGNLLGAEQLDVIYTDDRNYVRFKDDGGKLNPLSGLPFARNTKEELMAATTMNLTLRNKHHKKVLKDTLWAYPVLERALVGSVFHYWKSYRM